MRTELWTIPLTYTCKVIVINPRCHPQIVYFLFSVWLIAWCCEPGAGGGALGPCSYLLTVFEKWASPWDSVSIKLLQLQRERDSGTLSSSFPSNCLHWVPASWQLAIGWTGSSWWLVWARVGVWMDRGCSLVWCMSFFRSECEWMDVITVFTMARYKMDYFQ